MKTAVLILILGSFGLAMGQPENPKIDTLGVLETLKLELSNAKNLIAELEKSNDKLKRENSEIGNLISQRVGPFRYVDHVVYPTKAHFKFWTRLPGDYIVKLYQGNLLVEETPILNKIGNFPYTTTRTLATETEYHITIEPLDIHSRPISSRKLSHENTPSLKFITPSFLSAPNITVNNVVPSYKSIQVQINADKKYIPQIALAEYDEKDIKSRNNQKIKGGSLKKDEHGKFSSEPVEGIRTYSFEGLHPGTKYVIELKVMNEFGLITPHSRIIETQKEEFGFDGPVKLDFGTIYSSLS